MPILCEKHLGKVLQLSGIKRNQPCRVGDSGLHAEVASTLSRWSSPSGWRQVGQAGLGGLPLTGPIHALPLVTFLSLDF